MRQKRAGRFLKAVKKRGGRFSGSKSMFWLGRVRFFVLLG